MDNPSNINDIKIALELHKAAEEQLNIGREAINRKAMEATGLKKGDVVHADLSWEEFDIEVREVVAGLSGTEETEAYLRVVGYRLNKNGKRRRGYRTVGARLRNVTLVRRAEDNG